MRIDQEGWKSIDQSSLQPLIAEQLAQLDVFATRTERTKLELFEQFFSQQFLDQHLLPFINPHLSERRSTATHHTRKLYKSVDYTTWMLFFAKYLLTNLLKAGKSTDQVNRITPIIEKTIYQNRYKAIFSAHSLSDSDLEAFIDSTRSQLLTHILPGNTGTVDEAMYEYYGKDMVMDGVDAFIPHKPHPYGLINYLYSQQLLNTKLPITLDYEPRLTSNKLSPHLTLLTLHKRMRGKINQPIHTIADSAFCASTTIEALQYRDSKVTIAINQASNSGFSDLYQHLSINLPLNRSRTISSQQTIIQVSNNKDHITGIATTAWAPSTTSKLSTPPSRFKYSTIVYLYEHEPIDTIINQLGHSDTTSTGDDIQRLKEVTGYDISLPPPTSDGDIIISYDSLKEMKDTQLALLHRKIPRSTGTSKRSKEQKIEDILHYYSANDPSTQSHHRMKIPTVESINRKEELRSIISEDATIVKFYNSRYGSVDRINRQYYTIFAPRGHGNWQKLYLFSILITYVINIYSMYQEYRYLQMKNSHDNNNYNPENFQKESIRSFIIDLCNELVAKYQ